MKVAYIFPPPWETKYPSYTLALFAGITRSCGHEFFGFDFNVDLFNVVSNEDKEFWNGEAALDWREKSEEILNKYSDFVDDYIRRIINLEISLFAIYTQGVSRKVSVALADKIRSACPQANIILGGPQCFPAYSGVSILENSSSIDSICTGEADQIWPLILSHVRENGNLFIDMPGIVYRDVNGVIKGGGIPELVTKLDKVPFADYSSVNFAKYGTLNYIFPTMTSRGCINTCAFCSEKPNFFKFRSRSPENLFEEIKQHLILSGQVDSSGITGTDSILKTGNVFEKLFVLSGKSILLLGKYLPIFSQKSLVAIRKKVSRPYIPFNDSLINGKPKDLLEFCNLVIASGLKFSWGGMALLRKEMTPALLKKMKEAGCHNLTWGLETGSDDVIALMRKRLYSMDLAKEIIRNTHEAGISQSCSIIVGFPGETEEMFEETLEFVKGFGGYFEKVNVQPMMIVKNSAVHDQHQEFGLDYENSRMSLEWTSKDGTLDYQVRLDRVNRLEAILSEKIITPVH